MPNDFTDSMSRPDLSEAKVESEVEVETEGGRCVGILRVVRVPCSSNSANARCLGMKGQHY